MTLSENNKARMMEEAQRIMQEMRQRDKASREQEEAHTREIFLIYLLVAFWHRDYGQRTGEIVQTTFTSQ